MMKKYRAILDFTFVNPPLILAPSNPDHFQNIQKIPLHVMGMTWEGCKLFSGLTNVVISWVLRGLFWETGLEVPHLHVFRRFSTSTVKLLITILLYRL